MHIPSTNDYMKRNFDENRCMYFFIKNEVFIKCIEILEKLKNIIKNKFNGEITYSKKYIKPKNKTKTKHKRRFSIIICTSNID